MRIDHYHHFDPEDGAILRKLDKLLAQGAQIMSKVDALTQLVTDLDAETNAVAAKIDALIASQGDQIPQSAIDSLTAISDRLKTLGADPAQPIPPAA